MGSVRKHGHKEPSQELLTNPFLRLQQEVSHAMSDFYHLFEPTSANIGKFEHMSLSPAMDLVEDKECFKLEVEMPGMGEEDIRISCEGNRITISGEKSVSRKDEKKNFLSREISYGRYERSLTLPLSADVDHASASFKKGMLWITIPKKSVSKSSCKNIKIEKNV